LLEGTNPQLDALREALTARRQELGITVTELARRIGCRGASSARSNGGQTLAIVPTLFVFATALGTTVDAFFSPSAEAG